MIHFHFILYLCTLKRKMRTRPLVDFNSTERMSTIEIKQVTNHNELVQFVQFYYDLYRGNNLCCALSIQG